MAPGAALAAAAVVSGLVLRACGDEFRLPARLSVEEVVRDLAAEPPAGTRTGWLRTGPVYQAEGGHRHALIAPPPSTLSYRVRVPADAALRFAVGVEGSGKRDRGAAGVRFAVRVEGREAFARVLNPARTRHDRRWFEERVPLGASGGDEVEIALETSRASGGGPLAGTPGWSDVRVVRDRFAERQMASREAPSVLVVLVDTLRADRLGCYGARPSPSPTLDALAARGIVFEHMVAQTSWTMPAVASIMTGLHPRDHGLVGWAAGALSSTLPTLAGQAATNGITTVGVSANPLVSRRTKFARGFETFLDFVWDEARHDWARGEEVQRSFLRWLEQNRRLRFLAYLQYMEPHDPYTPPDALRAPAPPGVRPQIAAGSLDGLARRESAPGAPLLDPAEVSHLRALYDGEIRAWDDALARLLEALARLGVAESTVVIVTADHGEEFLEHGRLKHGAHLYEESIRVPLVIAGPGIGPNRIVEAAEEIDLFPTIARLLAIAPPPGLPGVDLLGPRHERPVFSETRHGLGEGEKELAVLSVRTAGWKLIHTPELGRLELYDLARDPAERENRFGAAAEGDALVRLLGDWAAAAPPPPQPAERDPGLREQLRALGYVQ